MNQTPTQTATRAKLAAMLASLKAKKNESQTQESSTEIQQSVSSSVGEEETTTDRHGNSITYNENQQRGVDIGGNGESCVVIGPAGTGKTTSMKGLISKLIQSGKAGLLQAEGHKHLQSGTPGIVVCAYTRRAVANIRKNMPEDMKTNCITIHKLLEYQPVYYEVTDEKTGEPVTKMQFEATRNAHKPLPSSIHTIVFEEGSMLGVDLFKEVMYACPHNPQQIFLGDIQQLPPVFGPAILGFKILELPAIELTEVYRQALESPIIRLAHRILSGNGIPAKELPEWNFPGALKIHPWKKKIDAMDALNTMGQFFYKAYDTGQYNPDEDIILLPFNKSFGTIELNNKIANHLARKRGAVTHQVVAGFNRFHFSIGDKVLYDKEDATIINLETNPTYSGANPTPASVTLDYWGFDPAASKNSSSGDVSGSMSDEAFNFVLAQAAESDTGDRVRQCSHIITLRMNDSDQEIKVTKAGDVNAMLLGYALTVHKSQGSEWRKVFFICHQSHATMLQRELLYTAVTRAKEELYVICEPETFVSGIIGQRVKGNTLEEKAQFFKGKLDTGFTLD